MMIFHVEIEHTIIPEASGLSSSTYSAKECLRIVGAGLLQAGIPFMSTN